MVFLFQKQVEQLQSNMRGEMPIEEEWYTKWFNEVIPGYSMNVYGAPTGDIIRPIMCQREDVKNFIYLLLEAHTERIIETIDKHYLEYCRQQNGRDSCKNCGLDKEELKELLDWYGNP